MKTILTIILSLISPLVFSQSGSLTGVILDTGERPLAGINLSLESTQSRTVTSTDGSYEFRNVPAGTYTLIASGIGYQLQKTNVQILPSRTSALNLKLDLDNQTLTEVTIFARRRIPETSAAITRDATPLKDIPQSIQVVDRTTIDEQQLFTVEQALKNVAGVNLSASYGAVNMRGFNTGTSAFLTNGIKGSPYPEGVMPLLGNIESIEVIHGASAILYGEGSLGGNINLVTKQPKKDFHARLSAGAGNFNTQRGIADVTGSLNKSKTLYILAGAAYQNGGRFTRDFDNRNLQIYSSLKWEADSSTSFQLNANYTRDRSTGTWVPGNPVLEGLEIFSLPDNFNYYGNDARYKGDSYQFQGIFQHKFNPDWNVNLLLGLTESRANRKEYRLSWDYDPATTALGRSFASQQLNSPTRTINPYLSGKLRIGQVENKLTAGLDVTYNRSIYPYGIRSFNAAPYFLNSPDNSPAAEATAQSWSSSYEKFVYNTAAGYIQDHISFSSKIKALIGLRYTNYFMRYRSFNDANSIVNDERPEVTESLTPRAGLVYQPWASTSFFADYNRGFIPQYSNEQKLGGPFDPETSHQFEIGYKGSYINGRLQPSLSVYRIDKKNVLKYYEDESLPLGYGYRPLEQVRSKGFEASLTGTVVNGLFLIANYSYNKTEISRTDDPEELGKGFYNVPKNLASAWANYTLQSTPLKGIFLGAGFSYVGEREAYFGKAPGYTAIDGVIGYKRNDFKVQLNANNLTDKQYILTGGYADYTPGTPANFLVTLSYTIR